MKEGRVYVKQYGTFGHWVDVGSTSGFSVELGVNDSTEFRGGFKLGGDLSKKATPRTITFAHYDPEVLKLYYGTDVYNNRGGTRKEEKYMGVREFKGAKHPYDGLRISRDRAPATKGGEGIYVEVAADGSAWFEKSDVPLIAHALFEQSGWPDAVKEYDREIAVRVGRQRVDVIKPMNQQIADLTLARAIANLAAYSAWVDGEADRKAKAEEAAKAAEEEARRKREHDELRTSPIALEALALYNEGMPFSRDYLSWDAVNSGDGTDDDEVRYWIAKAEAARAAKPAPKVGDRVRVSAGAKTVNGGPVCFGGEVEGVVRAVGCNIDVEAPALRWPKGMCQFVDPKYVTVLATAEDLAAEKAKAERDAGIAAIQKHIGSRTTAECMYAEGFRFIK